MAETLNPAQLEAVHHLHGPCLVVAGAGSGKTRVITTKIARLLQAGYQAKNIAAITFTNKAAQEMRERAKQLVGARAAKDLAISTFHSLGVRLLRAEGTRVGLKEQFSILDSDDVLGVLRDAGGTTDANKARSWQWTISLWKNMGLNAEQAMKAAKDENERVAAVVMGRYQERLAAYQAVDFDDLISLPLKLLSEDAEARGKWQDQLRYVLVDEYQDTNAVQYDLLKQLVGERAMFTAVGDDDQSIYGWRGATIENLKRLPLDFPQLKVIPLEQNYRSTGNILRAANNVIAVNPKLFEKKLWSEFGDGEPVALLEADGEEHEAERAVARIQAIRANLGAAVKFADFAILYRANHQARIFEQALRRAEIPYKVSGGQSFFDKSEIKDLCAWLRLLVNQDDDPAFLRAITTPKRGIGHQTLGSLSQFAGKWKVSMYEALFSDSLITVLSKKAIGSLHEFGRYINDLEYKARHTEGGEDAKALFMEWLKDIGYEQHLYDNEENEKAAAARWNNVLDFVDWVAKRCGGHITQDGGSSFEEPKQTVLQVAQTISVILSLAERGDEQDQVVLTTLHASKGLEWPHVFLAGVNEGLLPFKADEEEMTAQRLEEERRLMYVGITRARTTLAVSTLRRRKKARELVMGIPSRFIAEMKLHESGIKEDPREKLKRLRESFAAKGAASNAAQQEQNRG
ncbi:UvrD-helicase domain-containing protein [Paucibacter sediminis]|uniref:ATP-dependent DNA helicase Rep n=1 Tax=Paucibacter sediminis TaxID=3019553 RepID=A0AA95NJV8_9BURK|nr:UvrD-helicase domain-containing protein [Paucibacter sp. S2-9]WIT13833.1 UvrD-helicase domain-containing protein [Paucibacter sp. S2-9]